MAEIAFASDTGALGIPLGEPSDSPGPVISNTCGTFELTSGEGLTDAEAAARRALGEGNAFRPKTSSTYLEILHRQAFSFINLVLVAIGTALTLLGRIDDAIITAGMVLLNVAVGVGQEARAKYRLDKIALLNRPKATLIREGRARQVDPGEVVRGDVLQIRAGDQVVTDGMLIGDGRIEVDESLLTGESDRVSKSPGDSVYSGSFCVVGTARYVATAVGAQSFANRLTQSAQAFRQVKTPLQKDIDFVVRMLVLMVAQLGVLISLSFISSGSPVVERLQIVAVIAGLVPQGLFAMITLTYAMGALRMAGKGALIQQMNAIESLSNVDILCLDKTGTLTTNALKLDELHPLTITRDEFALALGTYAASVLATNKTSEAIAQALGQEAHPIAEEVPFSSARKWSAAIFNDDTAGQPGTQKALSGTYVLGAPEMMRDRLPSGSESDGLWLQVDALAERGLRVLLFAHAPGTASLVKPTEGHMGSDQVGEAREGGEADLPPALIPLGLVSLGDELRHEAQSTLKEFAAAGVQIKIISGDSPQTVASLARQAGLEWLGSDSGVISGLDLATLDEEQFASAALAGTIFGRISPQQKEHLVRVLKGAGHYVAMIGDGVNDVLSLKQAHVAVAMQSGSQVTRGVSDIVLLDDSFAVLAKAVLEGQRIVRGMQNVMRLTLTQTLFVTLIIIATAIIQVAFPTTPKLRSALTILTVGVPTLAIAGWATSGRQSGSIVLPVIKFVIPAGFTIALIGLAVYLTYLLQTHDVDLARSGLTTALVLCGLLLIPFVEPPTPTWVAGDELSGDWRPSALAVALLFVYTGAMLLQPVREFLHYKLLPVPDVLLLCAVALAWAIGLRFVWRKHLMERLFAHDAL